MPATKTGVWSLQQVRDAVLNCEWKVYNSCCDVGTLWVWGSNGSGELGINSVIGRSSPVQLPGTSWANLGYTFTNQSATATKSDGTLWKSGFACWGILPVDSLVHRSSPVQIPGTQWVEAYGSGTCFGHGLKSDGTLWGWGYNIQGYIGDGTIICRSSPVQIPGTSWKQVVTNSNGAQALKSDGTLWAWGNGCSKPDGSSIHRSSPVQIPGTQWAYLVRSAGINGGAVKTDGSMWFWGDNSEGVLLDGSSTVGGAGVGTNPTSPVLIPGVWTCAIMGTRFAVGRRTNGTHWVWGRQVCGEHGVNDIIHRSSPVQIPGTQWVRIAVDGGAAVGVKNDGTLWTWGIGQNGRIGDNTNINRSSPVQVPGTQWIDAMTSTGNTFAKKQV